MIFKAKKKDKFAAWLEKNQGGSFTQFYAESVLDALSGKRRHASLGPKLVEGSEDHARKRFDELVAQGIKPSDTVVDYGCGTLRLGAHFIDYLDADRYIGLDIDDRTLRTRLARKLIAFACNGVGDIQGKQLLLRTFRNEILAATNAGHVAEKPWSAA